MGIVSLLTRLKYQCSRLLCIYWFCLIVCFRDFGIDAGFNHIFLESECLLLKTGCLHVGVLFVESLGYCQIENFISYKVTIFIYVHNEIETR